ncbi:MAG: hypothetical protein O9346_07415 [Leptospiraceae bacterium]|jgi:anti-anti-sigma regulatory factor|nr:hypothetical protein [Leptospiraceae bacterium]MCZ8346227.1 hypothetical protein [Leptospiraceae bacterium]
MAKPRLKYFRFREVSNAIELVCLFNELNESIENEASSVFAMLYYQTRNHIKIDLFPLKYLSLSFTTRLLNLARDLKDKNRALILAGLNPSLMHFIKRFKFTDTIFLIEEADKDRMSRSKTSSPPSMEEIQALFPSLPITKVNEAQ